MREKTIKFAGFIRKHKFIAVNRFWFIFSFISRVMLKPKKQKEVKLSILGYIQVPTIMQEGQVNKLGGIQFGFPTWSWKDFKFRHRNSLRFGWRIINDEKKEKVIEVGTFVESKGKENYEFIPRFTTKLKNYPVQFLPLRIKVSTSEFQRKLNTNKQLMYVLNPYHGGKEEATVPYRVTLRMLVE